MYSTSKKGYLALVLAMTPLVGCRTAGPGADPLAAMQEQLPEPRINPDLVKTLVPSNHRDWRPEQAVLAYARFEGDQVHVHNIRNCTYYTASDLEVDHYDKTFNLSRLESVDFIMVPFPDMPGVGHTMLSFGFGDGDHLCVSVEIRKEKGETYGPLKGFFRQYELIYIVGDERDLIGLRANHELNDVYVYRARATPEQAQALFLSVMQRVNKLVDEPEFYDTLANNCTTNIVRHINELSPERVPYDYRVLLPGYSDELAYELGLLDTDFSFEETKRRAKVNYLAYLHRDSSDFSAKIRQ